MPLTTRMTRLDAVVAGALLLGSVAYLVGLPHNLGLADEAYFLFEAKRIRDGELLYRDIFQFITPIAPHVMAALYWLFGTTMTTARASTAVLHGLTAVLLYASARTLRVSAPLAAVAALAHVAISQPTWPFVSWHWFSTIVTAIILLILVRAHWSSSARSLMALGAWCGVLIGIQQQRGVIPTAAVGIIVLLSAVLKTRQRAPAIRSVATFSCGVALIVVPLLLIFVSAAGPSIMYYALVRFPLESYRESFRTSWGSVSPLSRVYAVDSFPGLLRLLPLALCIPVVAAIVDAMRAIDADGVRGRVSLILFAAACCGSVWYYPDFIHIAFVAGPLFVGAALSLQCVLDAVPVPAAAARTLAWIVGTVVTAVLVQHLGTIASAKWRRYPYAHDTAFGRVDFASPWEPLLVDAVRQRLAQSASQELFCYPALSSPYLTTGAKNPTPFQYFNASVYPAEHTARVVAMIQEKRVPYLLTSPFGMAKTDPIAQLVERDYQMVWIPELAAAWPAPTLYLFERKPES